MKSLNNYPRPDFLRDNWLDLTGQWEFDFDDENTGEENEWFVHHEFSRKILVPYVYQSPMSGIGCTELHDIVWYRKKLTVSEDLKDKVLELNFGAVDYHAKVWINGSYAGEHCGGYTPFKLDITKNLQLGKENTIVVKVLDDSYSKEQPRGKQTWLESPFACWYTRFTGIWQPVWINVLDKIHIASFKLTPDIDTKKVNMNITFSRFTKDTEVNIKIRFDRFNIVDGLFAVKSTDLEVAFLIESNILEQGIAFWDADHPNLYDVEFTVFESKQMVDVVYTYFGMRKVSTRDCKFLLNNHPIYQKLVLNQGYYPESFITPKDEETIIQDIKTIKNLGFNGVRLHQKIEDPRFLYWCDRLGLLVWEEMPSAYRFSLKSANALLTEWMDVMHRDYNHPCIITWVLFNESWGVDAIRLNKQQQALTKALYHLTKSFDPTRLVIANDGWEHTETDVCTVHDYSQNGERIRNAYQDKNTVVSSAPAPTYLRFIFCDNHAYKEQPVIMSEYGGISFATDDGWGYNDKAKDENGFLERFSSLTLAIRQIDYICGYCYTQYTDVEQEKNGLLTIDRVYKVDPEKIKQINDF